MNTIPFTLAYKLSNEDAIILVEGSKNDEPIYAYMQVDKTGLIKINQAIEEDITINFADYGEIIITGKGKPDPETQAYMKEEYNFS